MEREIAKMVANKFNEHYVFSLADASAMTKILTDGYDVYAIQKGNFTFLAWISTKSMTCVHTNVICW